MSQTLKETNRNSGRALKYRNRFVQRPYNKKCVTSYHNIKHPHEVAPKYELCANYSSPLPPFIPEENPKHFLNYIFFHTFHMFSLLPEISFPGISTQKKNIFNLKNFSQVVVILSQFLYPYSSLAK